MPPQTAAGIDDIQAAFAGSSNGKTAVADPRRELVQRVAASPGFRKSSKIRAFLLYACDLALKDCPEGLSEQQIGIHVFSRPPGYNPSDDNIVRAQARILRWKLEEYFTDEGRSEPFIIVMPKGAYHPEFQARPEAAPEIPPKIPVQETPARRGLSAAVLILSVMVLILGAVCLWLVTRQEKRSNSPDSKIFAALWNGFLGDSQRTLVVIPDNTFALLQLASGPVPLQEIISGNYARRAKDLSRESGIEAILPGFTDNHLTFISSATDVALIARLSHNRSPLLNVRSAVDLRLSELNNGSAILIGARTANPWMQLFDQSLNFSIRWDRTKGEHYYVNRRPDPGERAEYHAASSGGKQTLFGGLAYVPSLDHRGNVLMIFGSNEVAAGFITNEKLSSGLLETITARSGSSKLPHFEVLLKAMAIGGEPAITTVEAYRILPESASGPLPKAGVTP